MRPDNFWSRRPANFPSNPLVLLVAAFCLSMVAYLIAARPLTWLFSYTINNPVRTVLVVTLLVAGAYVYRNVIADSEGTDRVFWALLGCGLFVRIVGDLFWAGRASQGFLPTVTIYGISFVLFAAAFLLLVFRINRRMLILGGIDALNVVIMMSLLVCILVRSPAELIAAFPDDAASAPLFVRVPIDSAVLYLSLLAISFENRRQFTRPLMLVFLLFFLASWAALINGVMGSGISNVTGVVYAVPWMVGLLFFVLSSRVHEEIYEPEWHSGIAARRHAMYWFGPLAPTTHGVLVASAFLLTGYVASSDSFFSNWVLFWVPESISPQAQTYAWAFLIPLFLAFAARFTAYGYITENLSNWRTQRLHDMTRDTIAKELHRDVKQNLNAARNQAQAAQQFKEHDDMENFQRSFDQAVTLLTKASSTFEDSVNRIRPSREPEQGRKFGNLPEAERANIDSLEEALIREVDNKREDMHLNTKIKGLQILKSATWLDVYQKHAAVEIVNEALWNVFKSADNPSATVEASNGVSANGKTHMVLTISDKGRGFDPERVSHTGGLADMRHYAESVGGEFSLRSQPQKGTTVSVTFYDRGHDEHG